MEILYSSIDHIINNDNMFAFDLSYKVHLSDFSWSLSLFDDHGQAGIGSPIMVDKVLEPFGSSYTSSIWGHNNGIVQNFFILVQKVVQSYYVGLQIVNRNSWAKETLYLAAMQINAYNSINAHSFKQSCTIRSTDWYSWLCFPVLEQLI